MKNLISISFFLLSFAVFSQEADAILNRVVSKINSVKDYSVDANIKANIP